jgi:N-acetyl-1-D-myo-inositol-2-amino-2-deoxy-alpha-D-glucopyranoside deacetylase
MYASQLAAVESYRPDLGEAWDIAKIYWTAMSESRLREGLRHLRESGDTTTFEGMDPDGQLPPFVIADRYITAEIDANEYVHLKMDAMKAHATQITLDGPFFALSNNRGNEVWGRESFRLVKGFSGAPHGEQEDDLFAGLD